MYLIIFISLIILIVIIKIIEKLMKMFRNKFENYCRKFLIDFCFLIELYLVVIVSYLILQKFLYSYTKMKKYEIDYLLMVVELFVVGFMLERNFNVIDEIIKIY